MKNHIAIKFIAIALCALFLLGAVGGIAGIFCLSEMDLYNKTVDEYRSQLARDNARSFASYAAMSYSSKILGGCSEDMFQTYYGDMDWFIRSYPNHAYTITDAEGRVLSSYNMEAAEDRGWLTYTFPVSGNYLYLVEAKTGEENEETGIPRTVEAGETYLYDAIQPMGSTVYGISVGNLSACFGYGSDTSIGFVFKDESGRVVFRGSESCVDEEFNGLPYYFCVTDADGEIIYEISDVEPVGRMTTDENGFSVFTGNIPEPEETVPETTVETVPETTEVETEPLTTEEEGNPIETEAYVEETAYSEDEGEPSSASAVPEEGENPENVEETAVSYTEETAAPETVAETVPPTTVPVETVPDIEVTEPVMVGDKPLSSYQVNRISYYDSTTGEDVTAKYVFVTMPEMTVTMYIGDNDADAAAWNLVKVVRQYRQYLLPMVGLCLLGMAVTAVYLCTAAGRKPGIPEVRAGGLNRIPLEAWLLGGGCLIAAFIAGGAASFQYLMGSDILTACCIGIALCYLSTLVFVGFCYAFVAQLKTPGGYWWRNTVCGWCLRLCVQFAVWLECILSTRALPWLVRVVKKLWGILCAGARWLEKRVNRFISYLPLVWQWLLAGGIAILAIFASEGSLWSLALAVLLICYGAYCFGKLMDSASRMSKGDLDIKVDDKHMVGAFSEFAQSLNNLAGVTMDAARKQLKSERMKTELITNVSHDIKTPLTSIINYVDLLQKAQTEEERKEYLEVLDRQSQRLKKLIDDLMDMSKASTGNMSVDITKVDAVEAVNQALGEFADKLDRAMLSPVFRHDEPCVPMMADGRLVWRVLSNLLGNAVKYAMPGTRLYIDLSQMGGKVILSVKNISREELNIDADELMERFVRGDDSRNTEGSGLGLNIAKSLMELQKGELQLLVDGDLFKVTLIFPGI
ncbi:MAG: HAMP domain-containing sensor histidine kinase [Eubacteriales bacterium]|nr:HAMP domain-containing sensor histidine kinase [Eubacteriales bacterium]